MPLSSSSVSRRIPEALSISRLQRASTGAGSGAGSAPSGALHGVQLVRRREVRVALRRRDRLVAHDLLDGGQVPAITSRLAGTVTQHPVLLATWVPLAPFPSHPGGAVTASRRG